MWPIVVPIIAAGAALLFPRCGSGTRLTGDYDAETEDITPDQLDDRPLDERPDLVIDTIDVDEIEDAVIAEDYLADSPLDERPDVIVDTIDADTFEEIPSECEIGSTRQSYSGPSETEGVGVCRPQIEECQDTEEGARWQIIQEEVSPQTETCNNLDDNCDSATDESLTLITYSGPPGTEDVGICRPQIQECIDGTYVIIQPEVMPSYEICNDGLDNDCDGITDYGKIGDDIQVSNSLEEGTALSPSLTWTGTEYGLIWSASEIYFTRLNSEGANIIDNTRITNATGWAYNFGRSIIWSGSAYGTSWTDWYVTGEFYPIDHYEVYFARIGLDGIKIGDDIYIGGASNSGDASLIFNGTKYGIVWDDDREGLYNIYFNTLDIYGQKMWSDVRASNSEGRSNLSSLVWTGTNFGIGWWNRNTGTDAIYFTRIDADGNRIGSETQISNRAGWSSIHSLAWNGSEYGLAWDAYDGANGINFTRIDSDGNNLEDNVMIDSEGRMPSLTSDGLQFRIAWSSPSGEEGNTEIYFALLNEFGRRIGNNLRLTSARDLSSLPALIWTGSEYGVAWEDARSGSNEIYFARIGCN